MKTIFIGIDISKDSLDVAVCQDPALDLDTTFKVENSIKGISKLIKKSTKFNQEVWFCFEHTGNYGLLLMCQLQSEGFTYSVVPALEIKQSQGMTRGKNDTVDAKRIALYAATHSYKLQPFHLPGENLLKIKSMLAYRSQLVGMSRQLQNSYKSHQITNKSVDVSLILDDIKQNIDGLKQKIKKLETDIVELIQADPKMESNFVKASKVKGIGLIIAAYMLVYTNNFTAFDNPRKFNCYAGLAPFEHTSGTSIAGKTKTSRLRNKTIKTLLFNGANTATNYDQELKAYYKRKKDQGKPHNLIMNNIACKLVYRVFAVVNRDEPFVNLMH
jgi:transposase